MGVGELILVSEAEKRRLTALTRRVDELTDRVVSREFDGALPPEDRERLVDALCDVLIIGADLRRELERTPSVEQRLAHLDFPVSGDALNVMTDERDRENG